MHCMDGRTFSHLLFISVDELQRRSLFAPSPRNSHIRFLHTSGLRGCTDPVVPPYGEKRVCSRTDPPAGINLRIKALFDLNLH